MKPKTLHLQPLPSKILCSNNSLNERDKSLSRKGSTFDIYFKHLTVTKLKQRLAWKIKTYKYNYAPPIITVSKFIDFNFNNTNSLINELSDVHNIPINKKYKGIVVNGEYNKDYKVRDIDKEFEEKRQLKLKQERYMQSRRDMVEKIKLNVCKLYF